MTNAETHPSPYARTTEGDAFAEFVKRTPLIAALTGRAGQDRPAFTYQDYATDRNGVEHTLTWRELDVRVRAVAARIAQLTAPADRVAVLANQNLDYVVGFLATLAAGRISVPLFAPEPGPHGSRLVGALADCEAALWLTSEETMALVHEFRDTHPVPRPAHVLAVDTVPAAEADGFAPVAVDMDAPAYLQYTSGSTRNPAGAIITHRAIVANAAQIVSAYGVDETFTCAGWIPFFHDMGLVQMLCLPVYTGARSVFTTPLHFIRRPLRWLEQLATHPNVFTAAPNFAFEYAAAKVKPEDRAGLDLSGVRVAANGSEPVRATTIQLFQEAFGPCGFAAEAHRPSYGLAEATVFVSTAATPEPPAVTAVDRAELGAGRAVPTADAEDAITLVAAGTPLGQHVRIVDPQTGASRPDGEVGEIWVHGANVADGYWQQAERTSETFDGRLADAPAHLPAGRWLRTGDLGLFHDGRLYISGRMKDLIIVDGKNHYPQDIEVTVQDADPVIRRDHVAAFSIDTPAGEALVVVAEHSRHVDPAELDAEAIGRTVRRAVSARHDLRLHDVALVEPGQVLRTSSGKVARAANRARYLERVAATAGATR
jgi:fatty acid CoA ligase FadD32